MKILNRLQQFRLNIACIVLCVLTGTGGVCADLNFKSEAALLIYAGTGRVLYEKNVGKLLQPASLTKMVTEYLVLDKIKEGNIAWNDSVNISSYSAALAADWRLSNIPLKEGEHYTVKELFDAMAIFSSNSAAVSLAEHIAGSEEKFAGMMNNLIREFGIEDSIFYDSSGLSNGNITLDHLYPTGGNRISALSAGKIAYRLISDYPQILNSASKPELMFEFKDTSQRSYKNWNRMLPGLAYRYEGVDGLKTGHTMSSGYCFVGTARRNNIRFITVILQSPSRSECFNETAQLLDYGFNNFTLAEVLPPGYQIELPVKNGKQRMTKVSTLIPLVKLVDTGFLNNTPEVSFTLNTPHDDTEKILIAPLTESVPVGTISVEFSDKKPRYLFPRERYKDRNLLYSQENIDKAGFLLKLYRKLKG